MVSGRVVGNRVVSKSDFSRHIPGAQSVGIEEYACNHTAHFSSCCFGDDSYVLGILGLCIGGAVRILRSRTQAVRMLVSVVSEPKYSDGSIEGFKE